MDHRARNLEDALELADMAERMLRMRLTREHPSHDADAIERLVLAWLHDRPGAEDGDAVGRRVDRFGLTRRP